MPLAATCEEVLPATTCWQTLAARPVQAIVRIEGVAIDGSRFILEPAGYTIDLAADGAGMVKLLSSGPSHRIAVRFTAGLTAGWADLPEGLRHGVIRLAAHHYREREAATALTEPPAAVVALWRPWRRLRLT